MSSKRRRHTRLLSTTRTAFRLYVWNRYFCAETDYVERYGKGALATGATYAIGFESARELARELDPMRRDIGVLVNNAGMASELVARFHRQPPWSLAAFVAVNCLAASQLTRIVLPGMLARNKRGLIINVSSLFGHKSFVVKHA